MSKKKINSPAFKLLESAVLIDGKIYINAANSAFEQGLAVLFDGSPLALKELNTEQIPDSATIYENGFKFYGNQPGVQEFSIDGDELVTQSEVYVNYLSDWCLNDCDTIQIRVGRKEERHIIQLTGRANVTLSAVEPSLDLFVAAHRCSGILQVKFETDYGEQIVCEVDFDPSFAGGPSRSSYKSVSLPIPFRGFDVAISLTIVYNEFVADGNEDAPFVFIADVRVSDCRENKSELVPRREKIGEAQEYSTYVAATPLLRPLNTSQIELELSGKRIAIFPPEDIEVTVVKNYGHSLVLTANKQKTVVLFINGAPQRVLKLGENQVTVRLPNDCLTGDWIDLSIRDLSGSQIFVSLSIVAPRLLTPEEVMLQQSRRPFPVELSARASHRYRALRAHTRQPIAGLELESLRTAIETLDGDFESVRLHKISFPQVEEPEVSVIIPAHNKVKVTYYCLCALLVAHNQTSFEVVVIDDGSSDETRELENIVSGIKVIHNDEAQRFIRASNKGVALARGKFVVLLNNDTEPTVGWIDKLVDSFNKFANVGLAGSKLLYPDGKLQDAGGIVWASGNPWNYGNRENPWDPRFSYARQADYLSGAAMMTTKKIWDEVGGLSKELEPMYFEDTDFAFKVREAGYNTYFVPSSVVYHFEGITSGVDPMKGFKRYQEVNRPKFKRRWAKSFSDHGVEGQFPDLEKDRGVAGRVLFIDYAPPREDRDAGSYAARREIELVQSLGYKVTFLPRNLAHLGSYTEELEASGVEMIYAPFFLSVSEFLEKRAAEFDVVYITRYYVARDTLHHIRRLAPKAKIILNNADLHFLRELRAAISENNQERLSGVEAIREQELEMMQKADLVLSYNQVEHSVIYSHLNGQVNIMTCPWVVEVPKKVPAAKERHGLSFLGNFDHHPNAEGAKWFCDEVMPLLEGSGVRLSIYGAGMNDQIKKLASDMVEPVGYIENISDAYDRHRIFVAPLLSGAGVKGKVLSAIAHGIPTVLSDIAAEGIGLRSGYDCIIASTPEEWVNAILMLQTNDVAWISMSKAAREYAASQFSFESGRKKMKNIFEAIDLFV